ncbi:MAG: sodium:solute symporter [Cyclobacteriaceae bacterium]|nr:MAG: sodium:solute symporter [Cyclobacteriaceae bacterium]
MSAGYTALILIGYFGMLYLVSRLSTKSSDAATFFIANKESPWLLVSYGMIGVAISGITFISVPGQVVDNQFSYLQMVFGYSVGLLIVAYVLLPVFYKIRAVSIYSYLEQRFDTTTHKTAAVFFLLAQTATASFKLFLMAHVLQLALFSQLGFPFWATVLITLLLIWFYTYRGGIKTVIITDALQTTFLLLALVLSIWSISTHLDMPVSQLYHEMKEQQISQVFFWSWDDPNNFFKLVLTGVLLTVMTNGLDQSVMQKHLTCKNLSSSQKNIVVLAIVIIFVNILFLFLGGALEVYSVSQGIAIPEQTDNLYPNIAISHLGLAAGTFFLIGIAAAAYSSADSSLTGLTTSFCVDMLNYKIEEADHTRQRQVIHLSFTLLIFAIIMVFNQVSNESVLYYFIRTSGFIYGPLLGLFIFGIYTKRSIQGWYVPVICILAPLICLAIDQTSAQWLGYEFGYDILLLNSILTFAALYFFSKRSHYPVDDP